MTKYLSFIFVNASVILIIYSQMMAILFIILFLLKCTCT